jgi:hypothetical protein
MKSASEGKCRALNAKFAKNPPPSQELLVSKRLHTVADTFIQAQQKRNDADYDTGKQWTRTDVLTQIDAVSAAFESWKAIRDEPVAQAYLVSLLGKRARPE